MERLTRDPFDIEQRNTIKTKNKKKHVRGKEDVGEQFKTPNLIAHVNVSRRYSRRILTCDYYEPSYINILSAIISYRTLTRDGFNHY